jgi:hypothetical protein
MRILPIGVKVSEHVRYRGVNGNNIPPRGVVVGSL